MVFNDAVPGEAHHRDRQGAKRHKQKFRARRDQGRAADPMADIED